jgi:hypothetical protein
MSDLTLASVEEAFQQWRAGRHSRAEVIPEALWFMALGLYPQYKRSKICRHLQLSGGQFKQRLDNGRETRANHGFVLASRDEPKAMPKPKPEVQLTLQGHTRSMTLCFDVHALAQILPHVSALL